MSVLSKQPFGGLRCRACSAVLGHAVASPSTSSPRDRPPCPQPRLPCSALPCPPPQYLSNIDCLQAYPGLRHMLNRADLNQSTHRRLSNARHAAGAPTDFTLHGGKVYTSDGATLLAPAGLSGAGSGRLDAGGADSGGSFHARTRDSSNTMSRSAHDTMLQARAAPAAGVGSRRLAALGAGVGGTTRGGSAVVALDPRLTSSADNTQHLVAGEEEEGVVRTPLQAATEHAVRGARNGGYLSVAAAALEARDEAYDPDAVVSHENVSMRGNEAAGAALRADG